MVTLNAFIRLKKAAIQSVPLAFYDISVSTNTISTTDASSCVLGAVLHTIERRRSDFFLNPFLRKTKTKSSSSEFKTPAVVWAVQRLHQYLCGRHFELRTDHRALHDVLQNLVKASTAPTRIVRWVTHLLPYSFTVSYIC